MRIDFDCCKEYTLQRNRATPASSYSQFKGPILENLLRTSQARFTALFSLIFLLLLGLTLAVIHFFVTPEL